MDSTFDRVKDRDRGIGGKMSSPGSSETGTVSTIKLISGVSGYSSGVKKYSILVRNLKLEENHTL